jgi:plastocyanin
LNNYKPEACQHECFVIQQELIMSKYRIKAGDKVQIHWTDGSMFDATLLYMPQATGDLMHVEDESGGVKYINTGSNAFEMMILLER